MASEHSSGGAPAGSRTARVQAGIAGVLRDADRALEDAVAPGTRHVLCDLMAVLAAGQGGIDLTMARLAARMRETGALAGSGHSTVAGFLREHGRSTGQAQDIATVADHLTDYPAAVKAAEAGDIAFARLALVVELSEKAVAGRSADRHPDADDYRSKAEAIMVQSASSGVTDRTLKRIGRQLPQRISPEDHEEQRRDAYARRGLRFSVDAFGFSLEAWGDAASEEIVRTALESHLTPPGEGDDRTVEQRRFDALVQLCENRLIAEGRPVPAPEQGSDAHAALTGPRPDDGACTKRRRRRGMNRPQVSVVVSLDALRLEEGAEPATTDRGRLLPPSAARAFSSDCMLRRVVTDPVKGLVDIGRARRTFPSRVRDALSVTATTCQWEEGCTVPVRWCQGDHRTEWWEGGTTSVGNGQLLCGRHNREKHMRRLEAHHRAQRHDGRTGKRRAGTGKAAQEPDGGDDDDGPLARAIEAIERR